MNDKWNKLTGYLAAAERNIGAGAAQLNGGLIANIGQTGGKASGRESFDERKQDNDYNRKSAAGAWMPLREVRFSNETESKIPKCDDAVRGWLIKHHPDDVKSTNNPSNSEEVIFTKDSGTGAVAIALYEQAAAVINGSLVLARPKFVPRPEQQTILDFAIPTTLDNWGQVLWNGAPGSGKTTSIPAMVALRADTKRGQNFLVSTPVTDTLADLLETTDTMEFDAPIQLVLLEDLDEDPIKTLNMTNQLNDRGVNVLFAWSVQGMRVGDNGTRVDDSQNGGINTNIRHKLSFMSQLVIRTWIRDEIHSQYHGLITNAVFEEIHPLEIIDLTGTAYGLVQRGEYTREQICGETMLKLLDNKKKGVDYAQKYPSIYIESWEGAPIQNSALGSLYQSEEEWDPRKLLVVESGQLTHAGALRKLNTQMYGGFFLPDGTRIDGVSKEKNRLSILNDPDLSPVAKEIGLHVMPEGGNGIDANTRCTMYAEVMNNDPSQKMHYVTAQSCKTQANRERVRVSVVVKRALAKSKLRGQEGLVVVTHRMLVVGSDIDALGHIVLFDKIGSLDEFIQLLGRIFRAYEGKHSAKMYIACPGFDVSVKVYEAARAEATEYGNGDPKEYFDTIMLTEYDDMLMVRDISYEIMMERFNNHQNKILSGDWYSPTYFSKFPDLTQHLQAMDLDLLVGGNTVRASLTDGTGAKVTKKGKKRQGNKENKERKMGNDHIETLTTMLNESTRIGYTRECDTLADVFNSQAATHEFGIPNIALIHAAFQCEELYQALDYKYRHRITEIRDISR